MLFVNKLKVLTLMTCLMLVGQGFAGNCDANYEPPENPVWDGSTKTQPCTIGGYYIIDNAAKLAWYAKNYNSGNAKLTADIDLGGKLWTPIAAGQGNDKYTKIFDGDGHVINNLYINGSELAKTNNTYAQNLGFVGTLGGGKIINLILENVDIQASANAGDILGRNDSQISVGAFVGWMNETDNNRVENCMVSGTIRTTGKGQGVGGIVGNAKKGTISNCMSLVEIHTSGSQAYVGGIIGITKTNVTVSSCVYAGPGLVNTGSDGSVGGVVGNVYSGSVKATDSYFEGTLNYNGEEVSGVGKNCGKNCTVKDTTEKVEDTNVEKVTCILNDGEWNESTKECSVTSGNWDVGGTGLSLSGYGKDGYKIVFHANGGVFANGKNTSNKFLQAGLAISADEVLSPSRENFSFAGWARTRDATEVAENLGMVSGKDTIFAVWKPVYTITFNVAPGSFSSDENDNERSKNVVAGERITVEGIGSLPEKICSDPGDHGCNKYLYFTGWTLDKSTILDENELPENYDPENYTTDLASIAADDHKTIYAVWTEVETYTVTFNANEHGKTKVDYVKVGRNETTSAPADPEPQEGYTFGGWFTKDNPQNSFDFSTKITENLVLYAKWTPKPYSITYDMNGRSNQGTNETSYTIETPTFVLVAPADLEVDGYKFDGWFKDAEFKSPADTIIQGTTGNKKFYAKWIKKSYKIVYLATNEANGGASDQIKYHGDPIELLGAGHFSFAGYDQAGWETSDGDQYALNASYETNAPLTLYPTKGDKATYTITYECADFNFDSETYQMGKKRQLKTAPIPRDGYNFTWYVDEQLITPIKEIKNTSYGNLHLRCKWDEIYNITYVLNDPEMDNIVEPYLAVYDKVTLKKSVSRAGYTFVGWYDNPNFTGKVVTEIAKGTIGDMTFYAKWSDPIPYTITYENVNGATNGNATSYTVEDAFTLEPLERDGFVFGGWYTNADFEGEAVTEISHTTGDKILYAKWLEIYTITYAAGEGDDIIGEVAAGTKIEGEDATLSDVGFTREGYTQDGWMTTENGVAVEYAFGATYTDNAALTLYPHWVINTYTVTYNPGANGTGEEFTAVKTHGEDLTLSSVEFTREGYTQDGWMTMEDGVAVEYAFGATYTENAALTLYPHWVAVYTITYAAGEGDGITGEVAAGTKTEGEDATLSAVGFARDGYTQTGWKTEDGSVTYDMGATYTTDASVTLYPIWLKVYTITYELNGGTNAEGNPDSYTSNDLPITLLEPTKSGSKFEGWYYNSDFSGDRVDGIYTVGSDDNITLYAHWLEYPILVKQSGGVKILQNEDNTMTAEIDANSTESVSFTDADDISVRYVTFERTFSESVNSTIMLPFTVSVDEVEGGTFYEFADLTKEEDGMYHFHVKEPSASTLEANKPYIFIPSAKSITFNLNAPVAINTSVDNPTSSGNWHFIGTYQTRTFTSADPEFGFAYGFAGEEKNGLTLGKFHKVKENARLKPMRGYLLYDESRATTKSANAKISERLSIFDLPEDIDVEILSNSGVIIGGGTYNTRTGVFKMDRWYDLQGRKLNGKPTVQGTYYHNGKRVIVK